MLCLIVCLGVSVCVFISAPVNVDSSNQPTQKKWNKIKNLMIIYFKLYRDRTCLECLNTNIFIHIIYLCMVLRFSIFNYWFKSLRWNEAARFWYLFCCAYTPTAFSCVNVIYPKCITMVMVNIAVHF